MVLMPGNTYLYGAKARTGVATTEERSPRCCAMDIEVHLGWLLILVDIGPDLKTYTNTHIYRSMKFIF